MPVIFIIRNILVLLALGFLLSLILKKRQQAELNWAMFYASLWVFLSLPCANYCCVKLGFWHFNGTDSSLGMPYDLWFIWVVLWGALPTYFLKGRKLLLGVLIVLWFDILYMPMLEDFDVLSLSSRWLIGEIVLIAIVFLPAFLWSRYSLHKINVPMRAVFQFLSMAIFLCLLIPFSLHTYFPDSLALNRDHLSWIVQLMFIILLPSFIALVDLVETGKGTPFPYDPTVNLVRSGVYAYIKNPIQWSLTLVFIPLSMLYGSLLMLLGVIVSIAYTIGVSNHQENESMELRFGKSWVLYKKLVPSWYFRWIPEGHPEGQIYFKRNCGICRSIRNWFESRATVNLSFRHAEDYSGDWLQQVRYVDHLGNEYNGIKAIAQALNHINLVYASLGWFMRLPLINTVLQLIIDAMLQQHTEKACEDWRPTGE